MIALTLISLMAVFTGEARQIQGAIEGGTLFSSMFGTAPDNQEGDPASPDGQAETEAEIMQSYNATLRIPVAAIRPRTSNVEWQVGGEGGCVYASSGEARTWWSAPLYLPEGSTLRYFRMYYNDQNGSLDCEAYLTVYDLYGRVEVEWGISSSGTAQSYVTTAQLDHVVDYSLYSYVIHWRPLDLGSDMQVCGFRVYYVKPPSALYLPVVFRNS
jgi:hypothetical protein